MIWSVETKCCLFSQMVADGGLRDCDKSDSLHTEFSGRIYNKRINLTESLVTPFA